MSSLLHPNKSENAIIDINLCDINLTLFFLYLKSGSVWKEDSGCTNCICIDGQAKCTKEVCDDVICEPGYAKTIPAGSCCPVCTPSNVTCDKHLVSFSSVLSSGSEGSTVVVTQLFTELSNYPRIAKQSVSAGIWYVAQGFKSLVFLGYSY